MLMVLFKPLGNFTSLLIHLNHGLKYLFVEFPRLLKLVAHLLLFVLSFARQFNCLSCQLLIVRVYEALLANCLKITWLQVLDPNHLRIDHKVLVILHLLPEPTATWCEVKDQMEILPDPLQE